jgi:hypothetical protein
MVIEIFNLLCVLTILHYMFWLLLWCSFLWIVLLILFRLTVSVFIRYFNIKLETLHRIFCQFKRATNFCMLFSSFWGLEWLKAMLTEVITIFYKLRCIYGDKVMYVMNTHISFIVIIHLFYTVRNIITLWTLNFIYIWCSNLEFL